VGVVEHVVDDPPAVADHAKHEEFTAGEFDGVAGIESRDGAGRVTLGGSEGSGVDNSVYVKFAREGSNLEHVLEETAEFAGTAGGREVLRHDGAVVVEYVDDAVEIGPVERVEVLPDGGFWCLHLIDSFADAGD
jgi:hypothetical protein